MVSATTLASAGEALEVGSKITGEIPKQVKHGGRHWSYGLMVASAIVGAVVAVAAGIFSQIPFAIAGVLLLATGGIGAYYLKHFGTLKALEDYVDQLAAIVKKIDGVIGDFRKGNKELKEINDGMEQTIEEERELNAKEKKKLEMLAKLYGNLKKLTVGLTTQMATLGRENEFLDENVDELLEYIKQLDINNDRLAGELDELIVQNDRYDKINEVFKQLGQRFEVNLNNINHALQQQKKEIRALKEVVGKLSALKNDVSQGARQIQESRRMYQNTDRRLQRLVSQLKDLEAIPELIETLKRQLQNSG